MMTGSFYDIFMCEGTKKIRFLELNEFEVVEVKIVDVKFYDSIADELLKFAVIISKSNGKWVFCKHKERDTYEVPGGHRKRNDTTGISRSCKCTKRNYSPT